MCQEIEIEFKNMVTKPEFLFICDEFQIEKTMFKNQVNHYFDSKEYHLKDYGSALRIREKAGIYTLTLKQPNKIGLLETHQIITQTEAVNAFQGGSLPTGRIAEQLLKSFEFDLKTCEYLGSLTTNRAETTYMNGTLVFDHSKYLNIEDFEIEYEVTDEEIGRENFIKLFQKYNIPLRPTNNKIKRFFLKKQASR
ncbi:CYTH domain-containing protein [Anaerobacillus sp. CMMVII]|uniref:CYTH domain-containing protein n=1 Tax=Anaerobacillus sp. CMMVII TaxID=2755588 RepID=UPI0021B803BB|nr:CYTH domain-containing protein [Anaerobacillus sp. CMMVII]MCT8140385.1 CYTH domain-containing protein [Anaerobacillus sp. CMMVII]